MIRTLFIISCCGTEAWKAEGGESKEKRKKKVHLEPPPWLTEAFRVPVVPSQRCKRSTMSERHREKLGGGASKEDRPGRSASMKPPSFDAVSDHQGRAVQRAITQLRIARPCCDHCTRVNPHLRTSMFSLHGREGITARSCSHTSTIARQVRRSESRGHDDQYLMSVIFQLRKNGRPLPVIRHRSRKGVPG
jgi:hypothetical protein